MLLDRDHKKKIYLLSVQGKSAWYCFTGFNFFAFVLRHVRPVHKINAEAAITAILSTHLLHEFVVNVN